MDRIHRIGQHRPVIVKRLIIENSIESKIVELQKKKSEMIGATLGDDDQALGRCVVLVSCLPLSTGMLQRVT